MNYIYHGVQNPTEGGWRSCSTEAYRYAMHTMDDPAVRPSFSLEESNYRLMQVECRSPHQRLKLQQELGPDDDAIIVPSFRDWRADGATKASVNIYRDEDITNEVARIGWLGGGVVAKESSVEFIDNIMMMFNADNETPWIRYAAGWETVVISHPDGVPHSFLRRLHQSSWAHVIYGILVRLDRHKQARFDFRHI